MDPKAASRRQVAFLQGDETPARVSARLTHLSSFMNTPVLAVAQQEFVSFDGGCRLPGALARPERYRLLTSTRVAGPRISRGAGLSYCAASFGAGVLSLDHRRFNRVLEYDAENALVTVEAGMTLGELFDFLAPRGFLLGTQPGHPSITIGGCIAADAHGKNQYREGNFSGQVEALTLFHPRHGSVALSPSVNPQWFALTCGGYGLTGSILSATLRLVRVPGHSTRLDLIPVTSLSELGRLLENTAAAADIVYSWHDFSLAAKPFGRGVIVRGVFIPEKTDAVSVGSAPANSQRTRLRAERRGWGYPSLMNKATVPLFNSLLRRMRYAKSPQYTSLYQALFPSAGTAGRYFDFFGQVGFHEYQALLPVDSFERFANEVEQRVRRYSVPVCLASAKFFRGRQDRLRFDGNGICFAVNVPRTAVSAKFLQAMDAIMIEHGGIPNIIKDSRLPASVARRAFSEFDRFRDELRAFDSERLYRSELSERLAL